jgi:protein involved in polysaccharide export with SLBB domain
VFTLSKALLRAGGFGDFADKKHVKLTRKPGPGENDNKIFVVDVAEILERGKTEKDLKLEPGDLIFVPSRLINF